MLSHLASLFCLHHSNWSHRWAFHKMETVQMFPNDIQEVDIKEKQEDVNASERGKSKALPKQLTSDR